MCRQGAFGFGCRVEVLQTRRAGSATRRELRGGTRLLGAARWQHRSGGASNRSRGSLRVLGWGLHPCSWRHLSRATALRGRRICRAAGIMRRKRHRTGIRRSLGLYLGDLSTRIRVRCPLDSTISPRTPRSPQRVRFRFGSGSLRHIGILSQGRTQDLLSHQIYRQAGYSRTWEPFLWFSTGRKETRLSTF